MAPSRHSDTDRSKAISSFLSLKKTASRDRCGSSQTKTNESDEEEDLRISREESNSISNSLPARITEQQPRPASHEHVPEGKDGEDRAGNDAEDHDREGIDEEELIVEPQSGEPEVANIEICLDLDKLRVHLSKRSAKSDELGADHSRAATRFESITDSGAATSLGGQSCAQVMPEDAMKRVICKGDFNHMKVVGQFNLGFIIARLGMDLFIVDQHATDEKYRFEMLQKSTSIKQQPLISPMRVEVTAANELLILENLQVFKANGFEFVLPDLSEGKGKLPGLKHLARWGVECPEEITDGTSIKHLSLKSLPFSQNTQFGLDDINELCMLVQENPGVMTRLPKVMKMFASRACRGAVMIGDALDVPKMTKIVRHMAEMDSPWACPHGRPTMRHLFDLSIFCDDKAGVKSCSQSIGHPSCRDVSVADYVRDCAADSGGSSLSPSASSHLEGMPNSSSLQRTHDGPSLMLSSSTVGQEQSCDSGSVSFTSFLARKR